MVAYFSPLVRSSRKWFNRSMRRPRTTEWSVAVMSAPCSRAASNAEPTPFPETSATTTDQVCWVTSVTSK